MPRKKCIRYINSSPRATFYKPAGVPLRQLEIVEIELDEYEAIRLADLEGLYQVDAARKMNISRQTFGRILIEAHRKIAEALISGKSIKIRNSIENQKEEKKDD